MISDVPDGPAKDAGLKAGDVILSFDGVEVEDTRGLVRQVGETTVGKSVRVVVSRDGATQTILVTLGRREDAERAENGEEDTPDAPADENTDILGLTISPLSDTLREDLGLDADAEGLVVSDVDEASEAYAKGLRAGDLITEAGQQKVVTVEDLEARMEEARTAGRKSLLLLVRRGGDPRFVALSLEE